MSGEKLFGLEVEIVYGLKSADMERFFRRKSLFYLIYTKAPILTINSFLMFY